MKKYFACFLLAFLLINTGYASVEDNSIIDELNKKSTGFKANFKLETFETCKDMKDVMSDYIKMYWENSFNDNHYGSIDSNMIMNKGFDEMLMGDPLGDLSPETGGGEVSYSETNVQVVGVDESDIIKTDGKYIYYFNDKDYYVYVTSLNDKKVVKKIKVPETFYSPILYLADGKLTIISSGYTNYDYGKKGYWIDRGTKTFVIVYDVSNIDNSITLDKIYIVDGNLQESRRIGDYVYVISNTSFSIPYYSYKNFEDSGFELNKIMPQKIEVTFDSTKYKMSSGNVADCNNISYVLPDANTIKEFDLSPSYNIISAINLKNPTLQIKTNVIAGSNNDIFMSKDNLYMTSYMFNNSSFACPFGLRCIMPSFDSGANTLIHKLNIKNDSLKYQDSALLPGMPLNQYSMDEYDGNFRIITQTNNWARNESDSYVDLFILDKEMNKIGSLEKLGKGEQFKASRYIGDKLFLVTFEQIDPLFVIDVANPKAPKVLGELKIPGYSTYLHPYDDNHLIGIGYDVKQTKNNNNYNSGVKIDLYEVNYNKKCGDSNLTKEEQQKCSSGDYKGIIVKQKYSYTLGGFGSFSEALNNPRMFMWHPIQKKLFIPATLYESSEDDIYLHTDFFQGLITLTIDKLTGIKENYKITHMNYDEIEKERIEACSKYTTKNTEPTCVKLINGEEYCQNKQYSYVPKYCYANSGIGEYLASENWKYNNEYIKRALWVGDQTFAISNIKLSSHQMTDGKKIYEVDLYKEK